MDLDYIYEDAANQIIDDSKKFLNMQAKQIYKEHKLHDTIISWQYVIVHLDERIPKSLKHLHKLNGHITDSFEEIAKYLESTKFKEIHIVQEEKNIQFQLASDIRIKDWVAVKKGISAEKKEEQRVVKLEERELHHLHKLFHSLGNMLSKDKVIKAIQKDNPHISEQKSFVKQEEYYLLQIYHLIQMYEYMFKEFLEKEISFAKKVKADSKKIQ